MTPWHDIVGRAGTEMLLVADHASAAVPPGVILGVRPSAMREHVAVDIGVAPLARALCDALGCPAILGGVSRLVVDLNREEDAPGLIPEASDGYDLPGNRGLTADEKAARVDALWRPYHRHIEDAVRAIPPRMLISLHSFTPALRTGGAPRPWQVGVLYNRDERAARIAIPLLATAGVFVGDNQPYSGRLLNATMNRHAEANGIPYLGLEVRQDLIGDAAGVARWAALLAPVIAATHAALPPARG